jgi:hypothetical protein
MLVAGSLEQAKLLYRALSSRVRAHTSFGRAELEPDIELDWISGSARDSVKLELEAIGSLELGSLTALGRPPRPQQYRTP